MRKASSFNDWIQLTKPHMPQLNLVAAFGGYWLASKIDGGVELVVMDVARNCVNDGVLMRVE